MATKISCMCWHPCQVTTVDYRDQDEMEVTGYGPVHSPLHISLLLLPPAQLCALQMHRDKSGDRGPDAGWTPTLKTPLTYWPQHNSDGEGAGKWERKEVFAWFQLQWQCLCVIKNICTCSHLLVSSFTESARLQETILWGRLISNSMKGEFTMHWDGDRKHCKFK